MAYADANTNTRKLTAGAAVIALEAGLAWAVITGLAFTANHIKPVRIAAFAVPTVTPTPIAPPPPDEVRRVIEPPIVVPKPMITLTAADPDGFASPEPSSGGDTGGKIVDYIIPTTEPTPTSTAKPLFTPKLATPRGDSARWLTTDDYPRRGLINQREGRVGYRLSIDSAGRATACTVTKSSGFPELDEATCQLLPRRARFDPARNDGAAVRGSYAGSVTWRLPPEE
ncbi:MAG: TonB family protein [Novosphingobium sp.]|uniref:energy transducer TonB n=1 Tax=Novosphingobium sp. TaxID=1874826 RepID=UPI0032B9EA94